VVYISGLYGKTLIYQGIEGSPNHRPLVFKKVVYIGGNWKMSLAERLKQSISESYSTKNYISAKAFQNTLWGEPEPVEMPEPEPITDPRYDLAEDSARWVRFLELAEKQDPMLAGTLHGFRCQGTRLRLGRSGYVLRPEIDPIRGWLSQAEYERERDKWLMPHISTIKDLLRQL
jgi:hypothetical protein